MDIEPIAIIGIGCRFPGAVLTGIEAEIAINALGQQLPDLQLSQDKVEWRKKVVFRSLKALPIILKSSI